MAFPDRRTLNVLTTTLLFTLVLAVAYVARSVIVIFTFSILFAYLINPIVRFLQRHSLFFKNLRGPHIAEAYLALLILLGITVYGVVPQFVPRVGRLIRESPAVLENVYSGDIAVDMGHRNGWDEAQSQRVKSFLQQRREKIRAVVESVQQFVSVVFGGLLLIPILGMFFLSDGENLANGVIRLFSSKETYAEARALAADLNDMMQHYIRAKVTLAVLSLVFCTAGTLFLGYRHALALGLMAGVLEFIPVAGWITALITISTVGLLMHAHWIWMAALLGLWRVVMDYFIAPRVMGHELEIHPLLAIFTVMVGGAVGGIVGIYLSVPLVAALRVVWHRFVVLSPRVERAPAPVKASGSQQLVSEECQNI
jgi:predicted PurR-regulated permease PerM